MALENPLSYIVSVAVTNADSGMISRPFGYPMAISNKEYSTVKDGTKRLSEIGNPSSSWALSDVDQQNAVKAARYYNLIPAAPAHGKFRNQLFFDWHVAAVPK
jgi:prepilin-type processing-associated H-X9-DG protein